MQVILLHDVERLGHEGDVLNVADGYGRNYLLPKGLAVKADRGTLKDLETRRNAISRRDSEKRSVAEAAATDLQGKLVVVKATVGQGTRLHGTITTAQIADAAAEQLSLAIDRRDIDIPEAIREVGDYLVSVRLYKDVSAQLPIRVVGAKDLRAEEAYWDSVQAENQAGAASEPATEEAVEEADETDEAETAEE